MAISARWPYVSRFARRQLCHATIILNQFLLFFFFFFLLGFAQAGKIDMKQMASMLPAGMVQKMGGMQGLQNMMKQMADGMGGGGGMPGMADMMKMMGGGK